ncbi:MASE1 domain-containing protein [Sphingomonas panni]
MVRVVSRTAPTGRLLLLLAATGIAYYAVAYGALALTQGGHGIATLWPAAGILLAVLVLVPARHAAAFIAVAAIASVVANLQSGLDVATAFGFAAADMTESALAAWLLRMRARCRLSFTQPAGLGCFCKAVLLASAVSATVALAAAPVRSVAFWLSWFSTDLLGALIVTP